MSDDFSARFECGPLTPSHYGSLNSLFISSLPLCDKVVEVDSSDSVHNAMSLMALHGISSVPVYCSKEMKYLGWVDTADLVQFVAYGPSCLDDEENDEKTQCDMYKMINAVTAKFTTSVINLVNISKRNPFFSLPLFGSSIMGVIGVMKMYSAHRELQFSRLMER